MLYDRNRLNIYFNIANVIVNFTFVYESFNKPVILCVVSNGY